MKIYKFTPKIFELSGFYCIVDKNDSFSRYSDEASIGFPESINSTFTINSSVSSNNSGNNVSLIMNNEEQEIQHTIDVTELQSVPEPIPSTSGTQLTSSEIDNENSCVICTDLWTNSGEHHVVSLKCGHLFEKSCIEKWLPPNKAGICPTCKQKAKLRDIHKIFSRCLRPVDTIERGRAIKRINKLKKENRSLQTELMNQTIAYEDLKREYDEFRLSAYNCAASSTSRSIYNGKRLRSEEDDNHITISRNRNKKEINIEIMM